MCTPLRTAILSGGRGNLLQTVLDAVFFGEIPGMELTAVVVSRPDSYSLVRARGAGIPGIVVERELFPTGESFDRALADKLEDLDIDLVAAAQWPYPIPEAVCRRWKSRVLLPRLEDGGASVYCLTGPEGPGKRLLGPEPPDEAGLSRLLPRALEMVCREAAGLPLPVTPGK